jgi:hypothetical protein
MKTTLYFNEQVLRKRPYLVGMAFDTILTAPLRRSVQADGRIRWWGRVVDPRDGRERVLRVVTLDDGDTVHDAFFDRGFREDPP